MQVCAELYSVANADCLPSEETINLLTEVLYELPDLGDALLRAIGLVHMRLDIHITCLHQCLGEFCDIDTTDNIHKSSDTGKHAAIARFYRLLALFDVPSGQATAEKEPELHRLWLRVANLLACGTSALDRIAVLSCLLAHESWWMLRWFMKLLNAAELSQLIGRNVLTHISRMYATESHYIPFSSFTDQRILDSTDKANSEADVIDNTGYLMSKREVIDTLPSSVNDDIVHIMALSSTADHHTAWYHLYMICMERRRHFLDLFLVCDIDLFFTRMLIHCLLSL